MAIGIASGFGHHHMADILLNRITAINHLPYN